jgi:hypothetical protein
MTGRSSRDGEANEGKDFTDVDRTVGVDLEDRPATSDTSATSSFHSSSTVRTASKCPAWRVPARAR